MEGTRPQPSPANPCPAPGASSTPVTVSPGDLLAALASVPDPRRRQGTRFPLASLLALAVTAILANHLSVLAIAEWGARQGRELLESLGLAGGIAPHQTTLSRLFRRLHPEALSAALTAYFSGPAAGLPAPPPPPRGREGVAIDGKAHRGRIPFDSAAGTVHALSAFLHDSGIVLAQEPIGEVAPAAPAAETAVPQDKAEAERSVAPTLIARLDWRGRVFTGDALYTQRSICEQVVAAGGDYLLIVKENQPRLCSDLQLLFDAPAEQALPLLDRRETRTVETGHGRHEDTRHLVASTDLAGYSDWPHLAQAFRLERTWEEKGRTRRQVRYGITSLPPDVAGPDRLLALKRGHWQIENRDHYVQDVTLGEDRSPIHRDQGPWVLATLRDLALSLLHRAGHHAIASRLRYHSTHPEAAAALVLGGAGQNA